MTREKVVVGKNTDVTGTNCIAGTAINISVLLTVGNDTNVTGNNVSNLLAI
jgi:hypothetical protein